MKSFKKIVLLYITLLILFSISITVVHCIPNELVYENVKESVQTIRDEGIVKKMLNIPIYRLDTFTDCLMFNIILCSDENQPIQSAFLNNFHYYNENMLVDTEQVVNHKGKDIVVGNYARYWHGYLVFVRPLMIIMNYKGIRLLNTILLSLLAIIVVVLLSSKVGKMTALTFLFSLFFVNLYVVAQTIQFSICFYIALIGMLTILLKPSIVKENRFLLFFFGLGVTTSFFDLLTTPQITLGLPLVAYIMFCKPQKMCIKTISSIIIWGTGYAFMWASKWILGYLLTDVDVLESAKKAAGIRIGRAGTNNLSWALEMNVCEILTSPLFYFVLLLLLFFCIGLVYLLRTKLCFKSKIEIKAMRCLLIIALIVPLWYLVMQNHSFVHFWFTWRALIVPLWCVLLYVPSIINFKYGV